MVFGSAAKGGTSVWESITSIVSTDNSQQVKSSRHRRVASPMEMAGYSSRTSSKDQQPDDLVEVLSRSQEGFEIDWEEEEGREEDEELRIFINVHGGGTNKPLRKGMHMYNRSVAEWEADGGPTALAVAQQRLQAYMAEAPLNHIPAAVDQALRQRFDIRLSDEYRHSRD